MGKACRQASRSPLESDMQSVKVLAKLEHGSFGACAIWAAASCARPSRQVPIDKMKQDILNRFKSEPLLRLGALFGSMQPALGKLSGLATRATSHLPSLLCLHTLNWLVTQLNNPDEPWRQIINNSRAMYTHLGGAAGSGSAKTTRLRTCTD